MVNNNNSQQVATDWDVYWQGINSNPSHQQGGAKNVALQGFWVDFFQRELGDNPTASVLDLACGDGAISGFIRQVSPLTQLYCLDYSASALLTLNSRYPGSLCVAASADQCPFANGSFDLVVSQFGIEYAGSDAIKQAAGLVAPRGVLAVVMHLCGGSIHRECQQDLQAIEAIQNCAVVACALETFQTGFALLAGEVSAEDFKKCQSRFMSALQDLERIIDDYGEHAAEGMALYLHQEIARLYNNIARCKPDEVIDWLDKMRKELKAFSGRLRSMIDAAIDEPGLQNIEALIETTGLRVRVIRPLLKGGTLTPLAWVLVADHS